MPDWWPTPALQRLRQEILRYRRNVTRPALLLATFVAMPTGALAACPTASDLQTGIWVEYQHGFVSRFVARDDGLIIETIYHPEERTEAVELIDGIHIKTTYYFTGDEIDASTVEEYRYDLTDGKFPPPTKGEPHYIPTKTVKMGSAEVDAKTEEHTYVIEFGSAGTRSWGECTYKTQGYAALYDTEAEDETVFYWDFLPDLGISVLTSYGNEHEPWATSFDALSISARKPD